MMTKEQAIDLGKRAVAAGWRVWPGTLSMSGTRCTLTPIPLLPRADDTPDFRDPATLGILLAQVREAWNEEGIYAYRTHAPDFGGQWSVNSFRLVRGMPQAKRFGTEAEALVAALEAAKECRP